MLQEKSSIWLTLLHPLCLTWRYKRYSNEKLIHQGREVISKNENCVLCSFQRTHVEAVLWGLDGCVDDPEKMQFYKLPASCLSLSRPVSPLVKTREQCTQLGDDTDARRQKACSDTVGRLVNTLGCPWRAKVESSRSGSNRDGLRQTRFASLYLSPSLSSSPTLCRLQLAALGQRNHITALPSTLTAKWGLNRCLKHTQGRLFVSAWTAEVCHYVVS